MSAFRMHVGFSMEVVPIWWLDKPPLFVFFNNIVYKRSTPIKIKIAPSSHGPITKLASLHAHR